jgi:hypothetical protein
MCGLPVLRYNRGEGQKSWSIKGISFDTSRENPVGVFGIVQLKETSIMAIGDNVIGTSNYHVEYMDVVQHWHSGSEPYAGGDALVTLLSQGWEMQEDVYVEKREFAGKRSVSVYHVVLERDGQIIKMPVVRNPYINRLLRSGNFNQIPLEDMELG